MAKSKITSVSKVKTIKEAGEFRDDHDFTGYDAGGPDIEFNTLTTPHQSLRAFTPADAPVLHRILNEVDILKYYPNPSAPDLERVERFIQRQLAHWEQYGYGWWAVVPHGQDEMIGWNGLQFLPETGETEVGYLLSTAFWGRGLATDGARAALEWGFANFPLDEIVGLVHPENIASQRVLEKSGLTFRERANYFGMDVFRYTLKRVGASR